MIKSKAGLGLLVAASVAAGSLAASDAQAAKPSPKHAKRVKRKSPYRVIKRVKTRNGYQCHTHFRATRPEKGTDWSSRKRHGRSLTHCHKPKPKRVHRSSGSSAWVLPRYVVMCESGGNPRAVNLTPAGVANGVPSGLYQITRPTWLGYGGGAFASEARYASVYEQGVIAKRVLAGQGPRAWACW